MQLQGKTALITGSARGIGRAFAQAYLREGARVIIADIDEARASETAMELDRDNALAVQMDVTDVASIETALGVAKSYGFGEIDILMLLLKRTLFS